jgi:hypothetical protein
VSSTAAAVSTNKTSYTSGDTITVTVNHGDGNVQEWIALYVASNPDSAWSFEGNWQYLNGQQSAPTTPVSYPVTLSFIAPSTPGTYNIRYFAFNGYSNRLAISQNFTVAVPTMAVAAPTITPNGGSFTGSVSATIQTATSGASIYYTTDGSTPTRSSSLYTGALQLTTSAIIKAKAFRDGYNASTESAASFTINTVTSGTTGAGNLKYVSPNGSGTTCSSASPCAISRIGVAAIPGDTWVLKNGTYTGSGSILFINGVNGTSTNHIRVTAENPGGATLQGDGTAGYVLRITNASYWQFDNLVVRNRDNPGNTLSYSALASKFPCLLPSHV